MKEKMWEGRFEASMAKSMEALSFSLESDLTMVYEDVEGTKAHCSGLVQSGVLTGDELEIIEKNIDQVYADIISGKDLFNENDEDVHMAVERILTERIGDLGKKIHTGRSRNDQVQTDFKLYQRNRVVEIIDLINSLQKTVFAIASDYRDEIMPGYTHVQQAQPILFSHYILSLFWVLDRDKKRFQNFLELHNELPLGSGALAGSAFPYERELVAEKLGFPEISRNSIDATTHRDSALELLSNISIVGSTLSRYAEDFVNWSTVEFGFLTLHDAFSSGSSIMPQKKNPDSMELIRGKAGRLFGNLQALLSIVKGAPLCYSRDLQEDKLPVFDSVQQIKVILEVMEGAMKTATWNFETMYKKMDPALLATDLADLLVEAGIPFRDAHHIVGTLIGKSVKAKCSFLDLSDEDWKDVPNAAETRAKITYKFSVNRRNIAGGTGDKSVENQLKEAEKRLK
ncbi:MAG: argininosuccinate lyase [Fibrobacterales bacterium]